MLDRKPARLFTSALILTLMTLVTGSSYAQQAPSQSRTGTTLIQGTPLPVTGNAVKKAQEIKTEQIICRGGPTFNFGFSDPALHEQDLQDTALEFNIDKVKRIPGDLAVVMQLNFTPVMDEYGRRLKAGENGEDLRPATCGFVNRSFKDDDPPGIRFETLRPIRIPATNAPAPPPKSARQAKAALEARADAQTIPDYLSFPEHYWTFHVYKRPYGTFVAADHGQFTRKMDTPIAATGKEIGSDKFAVARLTDIDVVPGLNDVTFHFTSRRDVQPVIELSLEAPVVHPDGRITMNVLHPMLASLDRKNSNDIVTRWTAMRPDLRQGTEYYYLITVPSVGSYPQQQASGKFTTLAQKITITYSTLRILHLGEDERLHFTFWVNPGADDHTRYKFDRPGVDPRGNPWQAGRTYRINREFVLTGEVDRIRLLVGGSFRDEGLASCFTPAFSESPLYFENARPYVDDCQHFNVAKAEYSLSNPLLATGSRNMPFTLRAMLGPHGAQLAFEVHGSIEVVRPQPQRRASR